MASLIQGYEYDIFISYRQKDNKYDGWVNEFVTNLRKELEATFKEQVSVYFDENPHDGLLETHQVDKSLEDKLKCLVFVPIISQTYCDTKSFAWQHEFCAFNAVAKADRLGRDIRLSNGNVASRILPIKIRDLDSDDKMVLENELGVPVRAVEFIFKSSGVNRPLTPLDNPDKNLNKTFYRDQINKVANAVKEIIYSLNKDTAKPPTLKPALGKTLKNISVQPHARLRLLALIIAVFAAVSFYFFKVRTSDPKPEKSIAVLRFANLSGDKDQEYYSDGMMGEIINQLVKIRELSVITSQSSMNYRDIKKTYGQIARELNVASILEGTVQKSGDRVRIAVRLIDPDSEKNLWSQIFVRDVKDVFSMQADISKNIARELRAVLSIKDQQNLSLVPTTSNEAYDFYLKSLYYQRRNDWILGIEMCNKAIQLDSNFALAYVLRSNLNGNHFFNKFPTWEGRDKLAKADMLRAVALNPDLPEVRVCQAFTLYHTERRYDDAIRILMELQGERPKDSQVYFWLGIIQRRNGMWRDARRNLEYALGLDPSNTDYLNETAALYQALHLYDSAIATAKKSLSIDPEAGSAGLCVYGAMLAWKGDVDKANATIENSSGKSGLETISDSMRLEWSRHYYKRQFDELLRLYVRLRDHIEEDQEYYGSTSLRIARIHYLRRNLPAAKSYATQAAAVIQGHLKHTGEDFRIYSALGYANAFAGNMNDAVKYAEKAASIMPLKLDTYGGGIVSEQALAEIYVLAGKYDLAMDRLEHLLSIPGNISVPILRIDPAYDKLRGLPRFAKIISSDIKVNY